MKKLFLILALLLLPHSAFAAFDAAGNGSGCSTTCTFAHTVTGANAVLFVQQTLNTNTDNSTGCTYDVNGGGATAMTLITKLDNTLTGWHYLYYILIASPDGASHNVVCTAGTAGSDSSASYTNVLQTLKYANPSRTDSYNSGQTSSAGSLTTSTSTVNDNSWMVTSIYDGDITVSASTNVTSRFIGAAGFAFFGIGDSNGAITPAGSFSQTWASSPSRAMSMIVASFSPVATAAAPPSTRVLVQVIFSLIPPLKEIFTV